MNIKHLSNFVEIVDEGSLSGAARRLHIAQPALTIQIAHLEQDLGCKLLVRSSRGVKPTSAGLSLYREARSILRQFEQIKRVIKLNSAEAAGEVTVGFTSSLSPFFSTSVAAAVNRKLPQVRLKIFEGESLLQRELLLKNRIELAVLCEHEIGNDFPHRPLFRQRLAMMANTSVHTREGGAPISLSDAAQRISCIPSVGNPIREAFDAAIKQYGIRSNIHVELNSFFTLVGSVESGLGDGINLWLPNIGNTEARYMSRPIVEPEIWVNASLCRSASLDPSPTALLVEEVVAQVVLDRIAQPDWPGVAPYETQP
ncbi:MAG: LysR substrate-binding domain-containing protein [Hyphomicrobiales bacterium]